MMNEFIIHELIHFASGEEVGGRGFLGLKKKNSLAGYCA